MKNEIPKDQRFFRVSEHTSEITNYIKVYSNELYHFGTKGHSGRYPWGSGDRPYQRLGYRAQSKSDDDINRAYNKVIDESGLTSLSKRQERSIREAIGSTTGKNARRISLNRQSAQNNLHEPSDEEKKKPHHH